MDPMDQWWLQVSDWLFGFWAERLSLSIAVVGLLCFCLIKVVKLQKEHAAVYCDEDQAECPALRTAERLACLGLIATAIVALIAIWHTF